MPLKLFVIIKYLPPHPCLPLASSPSPRIRGLRSARGKGAALWNFLGGIQDLPEFVVVVKTLPSFFTHFLDESDQVARFVFFKAIDANDVVVREITRSQSKLLIP